MKIHLIFHISLLQPLKNNPITYKVPPLPFIIIDNSNGSVCINLMIQVSHIQGHEIRIVLYARLDGGDCRFYKADYVVYILMRLPLD